MINVIELLLYKMYGFLQVMLVYIKRKYYLNLNYINGFAV